MHFLDQKPCEAACMVEELLRIADLPAVLIACYFACLPADCAQQ
jgi:hypothetical protein